MDISLGMVRGSMYLHTVAEENMTQAAKEVYDINLQDCQGEIASAGLLVLVLVEKSRVAVKRRIRGSNSTGHWEDT